MMPRPPANKSDELSSAEPVPAPSKAVSANDVPHDERAESHMDWNGDKVKTNVIISVTISLVTSDLANPQPPGDNGGRGGGEAELEDDALF
jgi:hypothetical protein